MEELGAGIRGKWGRGRCGGASGTGQAWGGRGAGGGERERWHSRYDYATPRRFVYPDRSSQDHQIEEDE